MCVYIYIYIYIYIYDISSPRVNVVTIQTKLLLHATPGTFSQFSTQ